jgi:hypothetical protein
LGDTCHHRIPADDGIINARPSLSAAKLAPDAVLAYHAALAFHGKAYSVRHRFEYLTATAARRFRFRGQEFRPVQFPKALREAGQTLWGVKTAERSGVYLRVTSLDRTLVDVLDRPDPSGGWEEAWRSLASIEFLEVPKAEASGITAGTDAEAVLGYVPSLMMIAGGLRNRMIALPICAVIVGFGYWLTWAVWVHATLNQSEDAPSVSFLLAHPSELAGWIGAINEAGAWRYSGNADPVHGSMLVNASIQFLGLAVERCFTGAKMPLPKMPLTTILPNGRYPLS